MSNSKCSEKLQPQNYCCTPQKKLRQVMKFVKVNMIATLGIS